MNSSRRNFLAAGLSLPAAASASRVAMPEPQAKPKPLGSGGITYGVLGKTGLKVTKVAFGCMITSDGSVIERAADMGINYFDTARGYSQGNNEKMVGAALKGKRKNLVISTKAHIGNKEQALRDLDTSLKELGTDYVDIWFAHGLGRGEQINDTVLETQAAARKAGKIRFAGVSTHGGQADVIAALVKNPAMDVVLAAYNFTTDPSVKTAVAQAAEAGKGVVAMKVMAGGFRRAKPGTRLGDTLKKQGAMVAALKWVLNDPHVNTTVPSMTDMDQLEDNFKVMGSRFDERDQQILALQLQYIAPLYCRMCGACDGKCPQGVPVADVLRILTYADGYGQFSLARERFQELPEDVAAVRCNACSECSIQCPNGVRVAERLIRAQELFA